MNYQVPDGVVDALKHDYGFKVKNNWLRDGKCPQCGKKELYAHGDAPWMIRCGRLNNCGWESSIKDLYPDLFENLSKKYEPTVDDPTATARAYLGLVRRLPVFEIKGWYAQGSFFDSKLGIGTPTVRFELDAGVYWERFIENVGKLGRKAHFHGLYKGLWWAPPGFDVPAHDEIYLVEGIFDAIALTLAGVPSVALMSCTNYPSKKLDPLLAQAKKPRLVFALDSDAAGREWTEKMAERAREAGFEVAAAQVPQKGKEKIDWSDLYAREEIDGKTLDEARYLGSLVLAKSASEKARLMYGRREMREFPFVFHKRTYWFKLDVEKLTKAQGVIADTHPDMSDEQIRELAIEESGTISEIANCSIEFLYYQANVITDESWYYVRINLPTGKRNEVRATFTGGQLASASEFKKRLLSVATGAVWTGSSGQLDRILKNQLGGLKVVDTIDFIGYSPEHSTYVFGDIAVRGGKVLRINNEDFFDLGDSSKAGSLKSLAQSVRLSINDDRTEYSSAWINDLYGSYGVRGMIALAFWFGSLFAEQIRSMHKSFPFLEVIGEPGSGKSTLIEFLWKLYGRRDYEGFDPSKSTLAARARNFAQVSNLPVVLIEADRDEDTAKSKKFDWDEMKTAYNGRASRSRGHKNTGNETYEPPFRGSLVISQNEPVNASEAIMQRIVHLRFDRAGHTPQTKAMAERLERIGVDEVSGFILAAATREAKVLEVIGQKMTEWEDKLMTLPDIKSVRIAKNHAQIAGMVHGLAEVVRLPEGALEECDAWISVLALERQDSINSDHPIVREFWDAFDYLNGDEDDQALNHSRDPSVFAVNLNEFVEKASERRQQIPNIADLKRHLKTSKSRKFIDSNRVVTSAISYRDNLRSSPKSVRCWLFKRG
jgi:hypothetical protein